MFTVYGLTGQVFSGSLEALNRIHPPVRSRNARGIAREGEELGVEVPAAPPGHAAVRAYRSMLPEELERGPLVHAAQIMSRPVTVLHQDDAVARAWRLLQDRRIHQAPVLDDGERLVGMVGERELLTAIDIDGDRVLEHLKRHVRDVMTSPVVAAAPVTDIRRIAAAMLERGLSAVPILDERGHIAGIVSRTDVLRAVMTDPPLSLWR
ncbi:HPP family protein [Azovibrio restrictus]|uniref:CBS domain-containing protein n=1 Tax=Azovibrio restrictus TaxID=146938 RepID=UPI0026F2C0B8|nr:CBS domain-containing protein [Azovibrio restrictus]